MSGEDDQKPTMSAKAIPPDCHLLITSADKVLAWDANGLHVILTSSKAGIVAACEPHGASGVLAVADQHVVVMHDTRRQQPHSWGFNAGKHCVRRLEFAQDGQTLFFSSELHNDIQRYSVQRDRLVAPVHILRSVPTAWAISPTAHLVISATTDPPGVYIKNLAHNTAPILLQPTASNSSVTAIAFHPQRPNVFLLAFEDSTLAAYDATRLQRGQAGIYTNQETAGQCEIARLLHVHRVLRRTSTSIANNRHSDPIAAVAFLPGYKTRAISVGSDGRCRLVDFAKGGKFLRTWHAGAPLNSVAILAAKDRNDNEYHSTTAGPTHASNLNVGGPTGTNSRIAVGRIDGKVHIYDALGILLAVQEVNMDNTRVLGMQWVSGSSPSPIEMKGTGCEHDASDLTPITSPKLISAYNTNQISLTPRADQHDDSKMIDSSAQRYPEYSNFQPLAKHDYLDLFSPLKVKSQPAPQHKVHFIKASANSPRPRLSSQTFQNVAQVDSSLQDAQSATNNLPQSQELCLPVVSSRSRQAPGISFKTNKSPYIVRKRKAGRVTFPDSTTQVMSGNSQILTDLRRLGAVLPSRSSGTANMTTDADDVGYRRNSPQGQSYKPQRLNISDDRDSIHYRNEESTCSDDGQETERDIWLTSDSDADTVAVRRRHGNGRSLTSSASRTRTSGLKSRNFTSSLSSRSLEKNISPTSSQLREFFPRSSSILRHHRTSPTKEREKIPSHVPLKAKRTVINPPTDLQTQSRALHDSKRSGFARPHDTMSDEIVIDHNQMNVATGCDECVEKSAELTKLQAQVNRLNGEVVLLKTILRRNGVKIPHVP